MRNILWRDIERFGPNGQDFSSASASLDYERKYAACDSQTMKSFCRRESFIHTHGWSCPSQKAIVRIQSFLSPKDMIVEVGAGWGLWARLLKDEGFTVKATDALNQNTKHYIGIPEDKEIPYAQFFIDVEQRDNLEAMALYGYYDCLLLIWPPYDTEMAYETLKAFKGDKIIYIGEGYGGCTASDNFFTELGRHFFEEDFTIPRWEGLHDYMFLYTRKNRRTKENKPLPRFPKLVEPTVMKFIDIPDKIG